MILHDAFRVLINKRGWYIKSGVLQQAAFRDKQKFLNGKGIPEERIRQYLRAAGWVQIQQEKWTDPKDQKAILKKHE